MTMKILICRCGQFPTEDDMADVISLDDVRKNWRTERADCVTCHHQWQAVFPNGAELGLECPACGKMHGMAMVPENANKAGTVKVLGWCMRLGIGPYAKRN
jgi:hypothetical protein